MLKYCVGRDTDYDIACCAGDLAVRRHIFSIDRTGAYGVRAPLSTLELQVIALPKKPAAEDIAIGSSSMKLRVHQHKGKHDSSNLPHDVRTAWGEFTAQACGAEVIS